MRFHRILLVSLSLLIPSVLLAQSTSASLTGLVEDSSKALIPDATITAINTQTGEKASTTTNKEGQYVLPGLNPGTYRIEVDKPGFKGIIEAGLVLHVQDAVQINFHMAVGSQSESVTVTADRTDMNTQDGTVSTVVDQSYIANMPLNGRSFQDLILLTPGVLTSSPQQGSSAGNSGEFSVDGQRTESNYYSVDGVSANVGVSPILEMSAGVGLSGTLPSGTALGTTQSLVSVDDLQEFRVQSSTYSAEYGRNPGGQFDFETKSGVNDWHGSLFEYIRNGVFDAVDWFNGFYDVPEPAIHQNDFGGTLGGPVRVPHLYDGKDKTFFFFSYEGLRLVAPQPAAIYYVPDLALRASAPSVLTPILNSFSLPNSIDLPGGAAEFLASWSNPSSINSTSVRLDHSLNSKNRVFARYSTTNSFSNSRGNGPNPAGIESSPYANQTATIGDSEAFSNRLSNQMRLNFTINQASYAATNDGYGGAVPIDLQQLAGLPSDNSLNWWAMLLGNYDIEEHESKKLPTKVGQWNLVDSFSYLKGRHALKVGIDYRRIASSSSGVQLNDWVYGDETQVQQNQAQAFILVDSSLYPLYKNLSLFAQDEWHVSNRLNVSLGLRWDLNPPPGVTKGLMPYTFEGNPLNPGTLTLAPEGTPLWHTDWFNIAPRLGVAYILRNTPGKETVIRAGGGQFFDTGQQAGSLNYNDGVGTQAESEFVNVSFPDLPPVPVITNPPVPPYDADFNDFDFNPHLQTPYTLQWNVAIQQGLGETQSLTVSYVASHAARLLEGNSYTSGNNPSIGPGGIGYVTNGGSSDYNSLQVQFQRRISRGLTALAGYTWSHCLDYGSENLYQQFQRGNCDFDVRHNFSAALSYSLPSVKENRVLEAVLNHWGLDDRLIARTAFPITLEGNNAIYPNGQVYQEGLNLLPNEPVYIYGATCTGVYQALGGLTSGETCPGGRGINPNAFASVSAGLGNSPRNFARGFDAWQMNMAIRREFPVAERLKLQFRAEAFNIFNHPNFGSINGGFGQNTFGLATATLANSLGTLNPLYQMGGPRSMQFSLRLGF